MILILGVTASGKGRSGFDLARELDGEIVSIDSMKVYRRMESHPSPQEAQQQIRYHMIDVSGLESFSVGLHRRATAPKRSGRGKPVIAVGVRPSTSRSLYGLFEAPAATNESA
jgi:tRNA dimethylallyltransferase